jgi:hypothetical protein
MAKCYAQIQLTKGGPNYWLFSHVCGYKDQPVFGDLNNPDCGGGESACCSFTVRVGTLAAGTCHNPTSPPPPATAT